MTHNVEQNAKHLAIIVVQFKSKLHLIHSEIKLLYVVSHEIFFKITLLTSYVVNVLSYCNVLEEKESIQTTSFIEIIIFPLFGHVLYINMVYCTPGGH